VIILAYGLPKHGKSTLLHDLIRAQYKQHRFFVVEHSNEWGPEAGHWRGQPPEDLYLVEHNETLEDEIPETGVFVFRGWDSYRVARLVNAYGNTTYVDDEIDMMARKKGWEYSPLKDIVHRGRHLPNKDGIVCENHIMGACRRPQNLHNDITEIADEFYIFRVKGSRTLQRLRDDSLIEDDEWERVRKQPPFHFKHDPSGKWLSLPPLGPVRPSEDSLDDVDAKEEDED
jgi:hypothetical protein